MSVETTQASAENTDLDDSFEDAVDAEGELVDADSPRIASSEISSPINDETLSSNPASSRPTSQSFVNGHTDIVHHEEEQTSTPKKIPLVKARTKSETMSPPPMDHRKSIDGGNTNPASKAVNPPAEQNVNTTKAAAPSRFAGFGAALPSIPWGPPPKKANEPPPTAIERPPTLATTGRKVTAPFSWLTRSASSTQTTPKSPPMGARAFDIRRNTSASASTTASNTELTLKALDEVHDGGNDKKSPQPSLREKFKMLRLQEEANSSAVIEAEEKASSDADETKPEVVMSPGPLSPRRATEPASTLPVSETTPIDWDFWQTVVNDGPQAVAKTSPEQLNNAVSGGIPQTIRGVIWQVLAGSKNEDLETVYHELRVRGTKDEIKETPTAHNATLTAQTPDPSRERESVASSRSSVRSNDSTPATSTNAGHISPSPSHERTDPLYNIKIQSRLATERAKRAKDDAAALVKLEKMIRKDLGARTSYSKYTAAASFQDGLFNVCKAYALFDEAVGYPQGLNFIVMPLLFTMSEEEAFCLLVRLMNKYHLREMFVHDMPGLHLHLYQFERLLEDTDPALYVHLKRRGVSPNLYATQWFLTLFAYRFPLQLVMRVFDLVLCEGLGAAILKFGIAVVERNASMLLSMNDMQALTTFLKEKLFDVYVDQTPTSRSILESGFFGNSGGSDAEVYRADILVHEACNIKLTPEMLNRYKKEWEEQTTTEKARDTELENLRTDVVTKAAQIRSLEKRAEKSDFEHISIANDLVRLKVENQELQDENESLKGQVEELRKVVDSEATKIEEKMRAGTELVMQRNIEVQNENRHMEEQMAEMERELVAMKMKYAELDADHETLKQRWNDLKKALG